MKLYELYEWNFCLTKKKGKSQVKHVAWYRIPWISIIMIFFSHDKPLLLYMIQNQWPTKIILGHKLAPQAHI